MARVWRSAAIVDQLPWLEVEAAAEGVADAAPAELLFDGVLVAVLLSVAVLPDELEADELPDEDELVSEPEASSDEVPASAEALMAKTPARARVALTAAAATVVRARAAGWDRRAPVRAGRAGREFVWSMTISFGVTFNPAPESWEQAEIDL